MIVCLWTVKTYFKSQHAKWEQWGTGGPERKYSVLPHVPTLQLFSFLKEMEWIHNGFHLWGNSASCFFIALTEIISLYFPHCQRQQEQGPPHNNRLTWKISFKMVCSVEYSQVSAHEICSAEPNKSWMKTICNGRKIDLKEKKQQPIASLAFAVFWKPAGIKYPLILC